MLPVTVQFIVAMLAYALNERRARKLDYLQEENRVLKGALQAATGKTRVRLTDEQRRRLATKGKALTPAEREDCCQVVRPSTILAWFRQLVARKYDSSQGRRPGRPLKANDIRKLVLRIAHENPGWGWGYTKIRDALRGLKIDIGRTTVANILVEAGLEPAPERIRKRTWKHFMRSHWETLYACDFFAVESLGVFGTVHDRDPLYTKAWTTLLKSEGVNSVPIPASSPNCSPYAERFVKTVRSECLDHFVIFGERHLRHLLREFCAHYHGERLHQGLGGKLVRPPAEVANDNRAGDRLECRSRLGGLLNFYHREAA